jgi:cytochrome c-type biogenesis protein CcmH/NrfG
MSTLAALIVLLPWLRAIARLGPLPSVPWPMVAGAALTLAAAVGLYVRFGRPDLTALACSPASMQILPMSAASAGGSANAQAGSGLGNAGGSMDAAIASLKAHLAKGGGTADDWELLAKSYEFLGRPADAANARARQLPTVASGTAATPAIAPTAVSAQSLQRLAKASTARRDKKYAIAAAIYRELAASGQLNADGWADYADTAATVQGNKLAGEPETYIARALALDPRLPKALWLKASADEEAGRWSDAVRAWQQFSAHLDPGSGDAKIAAANLQQDLRSAGAASAAAAAPAAPAAGAAVVSGEVSLGDALRARASDQATLFIVAKSVESPGMPVAVLRTSAASWPVKFTLDDSRAMLPGRNLSSVSRVTVEARISASGRATPASGDLEGTSPIIDPSAHQTLKILINRVIQ